jgi:hypothetical protein
MTLISNVTPSSQHPRFGSRYIIWLDSPTPDHSRSRAVPRQRFADSVLDVLADRFQPETAKQTAPISKPWRFPGAGLLSALKTPRSVPATPREVPNLFYGNRTQCGAMIDFVCPDNENGKVESQAEALFQQAQVKAPFAVDTIRLVKLAAPIPDATALAEAKGHVLHMSKDVLGGEALYNKGFIQQPWPRSKTGSRPSGQRGGGIVTL